jgi:hypothetical protein
LFPSGDLISFLEYAGLSGLSADIAGIADGRTFGSRFIAIPQKSMLQRTILTRIGGIDRSSISFWAMAGQELNDAALLMRRSEISDWGFAQLIHDLQT